MRYLLVLVISGCLSSEAVETSRPALYSCTSREVTCGSDGRVCFAWCEADEPVCSATPEVDVCGDREACSVECVMVAEGCE
jgi:hypothetical protein